MRLVPHVLFWIGVMLGLLQLLLTRVHLGSDDLAYHFRDYTQGYTLSTVVLLASIAASLLLRRGDAD